MSGHNKWSKIKHKKAATDAQKSKEFGKLARLIAVESKKARGDTSSPNLKTVIDKAKGSNMPKDNIERAVQKGRTDTGADMQMLTYELYGPGGVAVLVDTLTDNNNRTNQELKHLVSKLGYQMAEPGAASWAFTRTNMEWQPQTTIELDDATEEALVTLVEALEEHDDVQTVVTNAL